MRRALPLAVLALLAAGCVTNAPPTAPGATALPALPAGAAPFTKLLCAGDALADLAGPHAKGCNFKVTRDSGPAAEVHLAVNPRDPLNLVGGSKDFTLGEDPNCGKHSVWSGTYASKDGGRTWTHGLLPGHPKDARKTALSDYSCGSDPVLAFDAEGTVYYAGVYVTLNPGNAAIPPQLAPVAGYDVKNSALAVTRSRDGGLTWDDPVVLAERADGSILDKEWMAVDPKTGRIYVTYLDSGAGALLLQRSDDHGQTWTKALPIVAQRPPPGEPDAVQFGQVAVGPDGRVHFIYWGERESGELSGVYHRVSADGGETWSPPHPVAFFNPVSDLGFTHKYRIVPMPAFALDPASGALYVAYPDRVNPADAPPADANLNVYVTASKDGGATWSPPARVHDDAAAATNSPWMPAIAVGPDSTVHLTWLDYRDDPMGQFSHVYYAFSKDGGKTWSRNARVSDVATDGTGGYHQSGSGTIGDYMGLAVSPRAVHPFWADTREGRNDVFSAIILG